MESLFQCFSKVSDHRTRRGRRYSAPATKTYAAKYWKFKPKLGGEVIRMEGAA